MRSAARDRVAGFLEAGAVGPVLHATVDGVDDVRVRAEGAVPLPVRGRPPPGRCLEHQADGIRRDVVRRLRAPLPGHVVEGPPLVPPIPNILRLFAYFCIAPNSNFYHELDLKKSAIFV